MQNLKSIVTLLIASTILMSCAKEVAQHASADNSSSSTSAYLIDNNISAVNIKAAVTGQKQVTVTFTTRYENDIKSIDILNGATDKKLCVFNSVAAGSSKKEKAYNVVDNSPVLPATFYMIRYTAGNGETNYSPVFKITL